MIDWKLITPTRADRDVIRWILDRAQGKQEYWGGRERWSVEMDLQVAHYACPMDLPRLLGFKDDSFWHDIYGIGRHLNRETGELGGCFIPRCAA